MNNDLWLMILLVIGLVIGNLWLLRRGKTPLRKSSPLSKKSAPKNSDD